MKRKLISKIIISNILFFLSLPILSAATLSVQIVQVDKIHKDVTLSSLLVEESILDFLFNQGFIVSNSPIITGENNSSTGFALAMNDARSGLADYLAFVTIFYDLENSTSPEESILSNIESAQWQLIQITDNKQIASGKHIPKIKTEKDNSTEGISSFGKQIATAINSGISKKR